MKNENSASTNMHPLDIALDKALHGYPDESEKILRSLDQKDPRVIFNLGWHEMRKGNLKKGLQMLDAGRFINVYGNGKINGEIWKDQDLENKVLLLRLEGGLGDQIIHFRFAKYFEEKGARVVVSCASELKKLFSKQGYVCLDNEFIEGLHYDYWVPSMSAAHVLNFDQDTLPGKPYLFSESKKLYSKNDGLKIGVKWSGNPEFEHEQHRKFDPKPLIDLHMLPGVNLYSLQRDHDLMSGLPFQDLKDDMKTWEDTASIIAGLDLVITSCTSVAHCSAALGVETWIIVPILPYYLWAFGGNKSIWYDCVELFRQTEYGNWDKPLLDVNQRLKTRLNLS